MTPGEVLVPLLRNISVATFFLRQLGFVISQAAWEKAFKIRTMSYMKALREAGRVSLGNLLSPVCSHCASQLIAEPSTPSLAGLLPVSAVGVVLVGRSVVNCPGDRL